MRRCRREHVPGDGAGHRRPAEQLLRPRQTPVATATSSSLRGRCWMTRSPSTSAMEEKATREELAALLAKMRSGNGPATVEEDARTGTCALS